MIRRENECLWNTYQVIPTLGTYAWVDTGTTLASPPSKNGYEAVRIAEIPSIQDILDSIDKIKEEILNNFYSKIGIDPNVLTDEHKDMLLQGVYYGIDDNVFFGAVQWVKHNKPFDNNYYFMRSKLYTDAIFTAAYTASTVGSAAEAVRVLSTAGASGAMSLATAPTGGGGVVFGTAAVTELVEVTVMAGVSYISGKMAIMKVFYLRVKYMIIYIKKVLSIQNG